MGLALVHRGRDRIANGLRRVEIRFADPKGNNPVGLGHDLAGPELEQADVPPRHAVTARSKFAVTPRLLALSSTRISIAEFL